MYNLKQAWSLPKNPQPIVIIGSGGIVNDAHLPAYHKADFKVTGIYDIDYSKAGEMARKWNIPQVFKSMEEATSLENQVTYDLAIPPKEIDRVLKQLPDQATVLIQKPMGENFQQALEIRATCKSKKLNSAINFQLRYSSQMLAVADAMKQGLLGELLEIEIHLNLDTPWHLFPFLKGMPRVEISVHSIHYLDLIRSLVGNPKSVFAKTMGDPRNDLAQTRTTALLDYESNLRCVLSINHNHHFGSRFQTSSFKFEGTGGAIKLKMGAILNYPDGEEDEFWMTTSSYGWEKIPLSGSWFPDAFVGTMSNLQRFVSGEDSELLTSTEDSIVTMSLVEACFEANRQKGVSLPPW